MTDQEALRVVQEIVARPGTHTGRIVRFLRSLDTGQRDRVIALIRALDDPGGEYAHLLSKVSLSR